MQTDPDRPTLLVVTDNQTLLFALTVRGNWTIETDTALCKRADIVLFEESASRSWHEGKRLVKQVGARGSVVITDGAADADVVLRRPFGLDELQEALIGLRPPPSARGDGSTPETSPVASSADGGSSHSLDEEEPARRRRRSPPGASRRGDRLPASPSDADEDAPDEPWEAKISHALRGALDLKGLLEEFPSLASEQLVASVIVDEILAQSKCDATAVMRRENGVYGVLAHSGLTAGQRQLAVPDTHPLVDAAIRNDGVLLRGGAGLSAVAGWPASHLPDYIIVPVSSLASPTYLIVGGGYGLDQAQLEAMSSIVAQASVAFELTETLQAIAATVRKA